MAHMCAYIDDVSRWWLARRSDEMITAPNTETMVRICAELTRQAIAFTAHPLNGEWQIKCTGY